MRFDQLPIELILNVTKSCDSITNGILKFTNRRTHRVVNGGDVSNFCNVAKIILNDHCTVFVTAKSEGVKVVDKTCNEKIGSAYHLVMSNKTAWCFFELKDAENFSVPTLPNLRSIHTLEMVGGSVKCMHAVFANFIRYFAVQHLVLRECEEHPMFKFNYLSEMVLKAVPGNIDIEFGRNISEKQNMMAMLNGNTVNFLTNDTLDDLLINQRKCFKLKNVQTNFDLDRLIKIFEHVLEKEPKVDWDFGFIETKDYSRGSFEKSNFVKFIKTLLNNKKIRMERAEAKVEISKSNQRHINKYTFKTLGNRAKIVLTLDRDAQFIETKTDSVPIKPRNNTGLALLMQEKRRNLSKNQDFLVAY